MSPQIAAKSMFMLIRRSTITIISSIIRTNWLILWYYSKVFFGAASKKSKKTTVLDENNNFEVVSIFRHTDIKKTKETRGWVYNSFSIYKITNLYRFYFLWFWSQFKLNQTERNWRSNWGLEKYWTTESLACICPCDSTCIYSSWTDPIF